MEELDTIAGLATSPELLEQIRKFGITKDYDAGSVILSEDASVRSIPIVLTGVLRVIRTEEDGREILLYYIKAGESCIMSVMGGLHDEPSKVRVEVEEKAKILFLPASIMALLIKDYPEWLDYVFRLYHSRFEELLDVINAISFKKVDERLLALLYKKRDLSGSHTLQVTHEQLASELGTARVVVSRLLKQLEEAGQVQLGRNRINLL